MTLPGTRENAPQHLPAGLLLAALDESDALAEILSSGPAVMADDPCLAAGDAAAPPDLADCYYRARYYDPRLGRFISEDPSQGTEDQGTYAYADNNPVGWNDPNGLSAVPAEPNSPAKIVFPEPIYYYYICCYRGQMTFCQGNATLRDPCLDQCAQRHERRHIKDLCKRFPCDGKPDGPVGGPGNPVPEHTRRWTECNASKDTWKCIRKCKESPEKTNLKRAMALSQWDHCGKGPRPGTF